MNIKLKIMSTLNDYKDWFQELDLSETDYEAADQLVHSMRNVCDCGLFHTVTAKGKNNGWIISADGVEDNLHLITPKQVSAFITHIQATICDGMDAEVYASFKHEMLKDD